MARVNLQKERTQIEGEQLKKDQEERQKELFMRREERKAQQELEIQNFQLSKGAFTQTEKQNDAI